ncbi:uncharacterized protein LOC112524137 [Cynara cardunculus var. scolymus]|uniref:Uncharacterized protein n=1 Tax=Cynara cardunculus var. scolymus TaxID=59895 RepID=A0A103YHH7_CYNCS|nr:uncharacterized protein LOC112524137 [Cynara cardunculus var. scolymus]KVI09173.1 hypothetical protein Ccrd_012453 [Cynara cardunculus var. scolymus]
MEINEEEWELINDDGFVYKRLKRPRVHPTAAAAQRPDPEAEAKAYRERKKTVLLKLKTKYQQEIHHWEDLSNTLKSLQDRTQNQPPPTILQDQTVSFSQENSSDSSYQELTHTLLAQVEAQEATIYEVSRLCDVAEALCSAEEQRLMQPYIDLPVWRPSPQELMTSLLEE